MCNLSGAKGLWKLVKRIQNAKSYLHFLLFFLTLCNQRFLYIQVCKPWQKKSWSIKIVFLLPMTEITILGDQLILTRDLKTFADGTGACLKEEYLPTSSLRQYTICLRFLILIWRMRKTHSLHTIQFGWKTPHIQLLMHIALL